MLLVSYMGGIRQALVYPTKVIKYFKYNKEHKLEWLVLEAWGLTNQVK